MFAYYDPDESDAESERKKAERLAAKIAAYWAKQGKEVHTELVGRRFHPAVRAARFDVRSDMKNGMPA